MSLKIDTFKTGPMFILGHSNAFHSSREEDVTYVDQWSLDTLKTLDPNCTNTYLKDYSRSYYRKGFHLKSIYEFNRDDPMDDAWNHTIALATEQHIKNELEKANVHAHSYDVMTELDRVPFVGPSAAGLGYQGHKGEHKGANHRRAIRIAKKMVLEFHDSAGKCLDDAILNSTPYLGFTRTQLTDITEKLKVRAVWGSPFHHILCEGLSASPFLDSVKSSDCFIHFGEDPLLSVPNLINKLNSKYPWLYSFDWSRFDATASKREIDMAFRVIKSRMTFPNKQSEDAFDLMVELFKFKKVVGPDGNIYSVNTGVPSGSNWTSIVDSIINYFRIQYLWMLITKEFLEDLYTHGDDGIAGYDKYVSMYELSQEGFKLGWCLNPDKSLSTRDASVIEFLGRNTTGGYSRRSIEKCLRLLVYPEYPVLDPRISAYRAESLFDDVGRTSEFLEKVSKTLKRKYGLPDSEEDVPRHHKRYKVV
jgi:hypothetical protein